MKKFLQQPIENTINQFLLLLFGFGFELLDTKNLSNSEIFDLLKKAQINFTQTENEIRQRNFLVSSKYFYLFLIRQTGKLIYSNDKNRKSHQIQIHFKKKSLSNFWEKDLLDWFI